MLLIHQNEMNLTGDIPFKNGNYELLLLDYFLVGEVVGVDTILCEPNSCELAPRFEVKEAIISSYFPQFLTWNNDLLVLGYLLVIVCGGLFFMFGLIRYLFNQ